MPSAEHGRLRHQVGAGLEVAELLALAVAALVAGADALDDPVLDQQLVGRGLGEDVGAGLLGLARPGSGRAWRPRSCSCRGCGSSAASAPAAAPASWSAGRPRRRRPPGRPASRDLSRSGKSSSIAEGSMFAPESRCAPQTLPFSMTATGTSPSCSVELRLVLEQLHEPVRAGEAGGPAADDRDARPRGAPPRGRSAARRSPSRVERRRELAPVLRGHRRRLSRPSWP